MLRVVWAVIGAALLWLLFATAIIYSVIGILSWDISIVMGGQ